MQDKLHHKMLHVLVATPSGAGGQGGIDRLMGALKHQLERRAGTDIDARFVASRGPGHVAMSPFYLIGFCFMMLRARIRGRCDLVHINLSSFGSTYRKLVIAGWARWLGIPYVLHLHGSEYQTFWRADAGVLSRSIRRMFEHASRTVVLGSFWRDFVASRAPGAAARIAVVANATAVPSREWRGGGDRVHILFLGRLGERKGVPQLCEALRRLGENPRWRATIAGDGEVDATRATLSAYGLANRVSLPGWVGPDEVGELLAQSDILVLPSFSENLPVSVIEAMAAGLAVVATPVGAVEDIITDNETGLLVPPGDVGALEAALARLVDDPALRSRLGAAARAVHRERLELSRFADTICALWKEAAR